MGKKTLILLLGLGFFAGHLLAQSRSTPALIDLHKLAEAGHLQENKVVFIEDTSTTLSPTEAIKILNTKGGEPVFDPYQITFRQRNSVFWLCFKVQDTAFEETRKKWVLQISYPSLDSIDLYYLDKKGALQVFQTGDKRVFVERDIKSTRFFAFHLPIYSAEVHTFYLRIRSDGLLNVPISFYELEDYYTRTIYEETLMGAFYGIILVLSFYNLFLFFVLRSRMYLMYVAYMLSVAAFSAALDGHLFQYVFFWSVYWAEVAVVLSGYLSFFFLINFIQVFLKTASNIKHPHLILNVLKYFLILMTLFYLISGNYKIPVGVLSLVSPVITFIIFLVCCYAIYKKIPSSVLLSVAFLGSLLGIFIYGLKNVNILPNTLFTSYAYYVGFSVQGVIFSLALAARYKQLKKELIDTQREANETLENKVKERTEELEILHQEMVTQNEELQQSQEEILAQRDAIEIKNHELAQINTQMRSSIEAAKVIQKAILPYPQKREQLLRDHFVIFKPKDVVSGDFYWLNKIENTTFIVVADCTGHGVSGAFMTLIGNNLLDKIIRVWGIKNPADILSRLNEEVEIVLRQKETGNNYGMDASVMIFTPKDGGSFEAVFAGAKQNLYIIRQGQASVEVIQGKRKSVGGFQNPASFFENRPLTLQKNDRVYMSTDGYIDQNNKVRKKILEKGFITLLEQVQALTMSEQKHALQEYLQSHMQGTKQRDDILVIGFEL